PHAQLGKERGLLRRSASVAQSVAPRKQASAARWVFSPHFLQSEPRRECSGPKFPWDAVREQPAPGALIHRRRPKLDKRLRQTQTGLKALGKDDTSLPRGISLPWEYQLLVATARRNMLPESRHCTQTRQADRPPPVRESSEPVPPYISFLPQKLSCS